MPESARAAASPGWRYEAELWEAGYRVVAGVDEAGRGAWAGPVVVAVVLLPVGAHPFVDSKLVTPERREVLAQAVRRRALAWAVVEAPVDEVDAIGVLQATLAATERGLRALAGTGQQVAELHRRTHAQLDAVVTDYLALPTQRWRDWCGPRGLLWPARADSASCQVAAASLLAKTYRDARMRAAAVRWPAYGFDRHKGYGVPVHRAALARHGPCPFHRRSFRPVAALGSSRALGLSEEHPCQTPSV